MRAAIEGRGDSAMKLLAVTVLTSFDQRDVQELGYECALADLVGQRVRLAMQVGVDGIVGSPLEARAIRAQAGPAAISRHARRALPKTRCCRGRSSMHRHPRPGSSSRRRRLRSGGPRGHPRGRSLRRPRRHSRRSQRPDFSSVPRTPLTARVEHIDLFLAHYGYAAIFALLMRPGLSGR